MSSENYIRNRQVLIERARKYYQDHKDDPAFQERQRANSRKAKRKLRSLPYDHPRRIREHELAKNRHRVYRKTESLSRSWRKQLLKKHGLTMSAYDEMVVSQNGRCAICGESPARLCVDHNHASGRVRGLLCSLCNCLLGYAKDSTERLQSAVAYLEKNS